MNPLLAVLFFAAGIIAGVLISWKFLIWSFRSIRRERGIRVHAFVSRDGIGYVDWTMGGIHQEPLEVIVDPCTHDGGSAPRVT